MLTINLTREVSCSKMKRRIIRVACSAAKRIMKKTLKKPSFFLVNLLNNSVRISINLKTGGMAKKQDYQNQ